jgi:hypothetical protein
LTGLDRNLLDGARKTCERCGYANAALERIAH